MVAGAFKSHHRLNRLTRPDKWDLHDHPLNGIAHHVIRDAANFGRGLLVDDFDLLFRPVNRYGRGPLNTFQGASGRSDNNPHLQLDHFFTDKLRGCGTWVLIGELRDHIGCRQQQYDGQKETQGSLPFSILETVQ